MVGHTHKEVTVVEPPVPTVEAIQIQVEPKEMEVPLVILVVAVENRLVP